jgi:Dimethlysulfonioproprionate lyase
MDQDIFENARWLIGAIARGLHASGAKPAAEVLGRLAEQRIDHQAFNLPRPSRLPALSHFAPCVAESMLVNADLAAAIASVEDALHWQRPPDYSDEVLGEGFRKNFGSCQIVGPGGFFKGDDFLLGLMLLGPNRHYKDHFHPAPELYWPLTAHSSWKQGGGGFVEKAAGDVIWHAPNEVHATRTAATPLLAVWSWTHDTATAARLVEAC